MKTLFRKMKLQTCLFVLFLCLILPIQLSAIYTYMSASKHLSSQIRKSTEIQVSFLMNKLEDNLNTIFYQSSTLLKADNQLIYYYWDKYDKNSVNFWIKSRNIMQLLKNFADSTSLIQDVIVYYPEQEIKISSSHGYEKIALDRISKKLKTFLRSGAVTFLNDDFISIGSVYSPASYFTNQMPAFFIEVKLLRSELQKNYLNSLCSIDGDCGILVHADSENGLSPVCFSSSFSLKEDSFSYLRSISYQNDLLESKPIRVNNQNYYCSIAYSKNLRLGIAYFAKYESLFGELYRFKIWYVAFLALTVLLLLLVSISINRTIQKPINFMINGFKKVRHGNFNVQLQTPSTMNEFQILTECFNKTVRRLQEFLDIISEQKLYQKEMELKQLQTQIAPHFLFNSFYMLNRMILDEDIDSASALSRYLGDYFQYLIRDRKEIVFLEQEYNHTMAYLHIQKMRFSNRLKLEIEPMQNDINQVLVPRLIIQPIVENSISYSLQSSSSDCIIHIVFQKYENHLVIVEEDNGNTLTDEKLKELIEALQSNGGIEITGLINTHRRLVLLYGTEYGLHLSRSNLGGMRTELHIPLQWDYKKKE